jgi:hypothetical protein
MSTISAELEQEFANELGFGGGPSPAAELEGPQVQESEAFFNHLAAMADRSGRTQSLRRIAFAAARSAYQGALAKRPTTLIEGESEAQANAELEHELIAACTTPRSAEALLPEMEHLGHAASEAETEQEAAEHFLPLIPLAAKALLPLAAKAAPMLLKAGGAIAKKILPKVIAKVAPNLTRGVGNLARTLHRSPLTRNLLRTVPRIAQRTVGSLAQRAARGQRITPRVAGATLARQAARVLGRPRHAVAAFRRSRLLDRRHHLRARRVLGPPRPGSGVSVGGGGGAPGGGHVPLGGVSYAGPAGPVPGVPYAGPTVAGVAGGCCPCPPPAVCPSCGR